MDAWLRGLLENLMDDLFDSKRAAEIKRQASHFMVEGVDKQNLYVGYINGFVSGYAESAMTLMCVKDPTRAEQDEIRTLIMKRSEEMLKRFGIL
ncbi:MAG: hypothetical protein SVE93_02920 [Candidatus Thermoplasmatota archaeon]|nr:hypothetical protein [Candidatus Thermoplasmatota archaeon]